ncbi:hypothetical protein MJT46_006058 [Ovis ammon polii x Ovis aries]|nr:hypothetical protein MJT46_006058 [Ovis ammon polii x Ovis aries]
MEMAEVKTVEAADGQDSPRAVVMPGSLSGSSLPPHHSEQMPQAHKPPPATCLPPTTTQCLATLALTLLALEASLALAPALSLQGFGVTC